MADPVGNDAYKGLAMPLYGESKLVQRNSSNAILTFQHSTEDAGRLMLGTDVRSSGTTAQPFSSILDNLAVWDIDGAGGYRALSGTTILMELNSSFVGVEGLSSARDWQIDSSGVWTGTKRQITTVTTGANFTISSTQSGTLFLVGHTSGTSMYIILPGDAPTGTWFDIWLTSGDAGSSLGEVNITSTAGSGRIHMSGTPTSAVSSGKSIMNGSTNASIGVRLIRIVDDDVWIAVGTGFQQTTGDSTNLTLPDLQRGSWFAGSTIA